jgi:hypothetical protein
VGRPAPAVAGLDPGGHPLDVPVSARPGRLALLFLTSSCRPCRDLWSAAQAMPAPPDPAARAVIILTPSPSTESRRRVADLAPPSVPVLMSSDAWHAYGVTRAPWLALLEGGTITAEGPAPADWTKVVATDSAVSADRPAPPRPP